MARGDPGYKRGAVTTLDPAAAPQFVKNWLAEVRPEIDAYLDACLQIPGSAATERLLEAMRYAALGPGKRLRPALTLAACEAVGGDRASALPAAAAVELLHTYTLVHDDLPCMDDDDERRGRPTVHVAYDEALAVLAGDALLSEAFGVLAKLGPRAGDAVAVLARRAGTAELLAGQVHDLVIEAREEAPSFEELEALHAAKTGALFAAAVELGAIAGGASAEDRANLARYGLAIGVAFQHADDRDDGDFPAYAEQASARMRALTDEAIELAGALGARAQTLLAVAEWMGSRA
ncbi:Polyprenyl synthetase [Haliangium ochraceum DSM 14365]|uniref:Polyprenyl synthetase n=1 Tax=Haliangium ochraceum (strain DSM 14365 / JCM 11303 / SMP-2) TaxID=502025 RepID=D0LIN0_HALO1|nr:Polyprenyl synthetase [Haliangium ochraceum DSM 14365]